MLSAVGQEEDVGSPSCDWAVGAGEKGIECLPYAAGGGGGGGVYSESNTRGGAIPNEMGSARCRGGVNISATILW